MRQRDIARARAMRLLMCQLALIIVATLFCLTLTWNVQVTYSLLVGAMCYWLPSALFAWRMFSSENTPKAMVRSFYKGEAHKFILTALLFGIAFKFLAVKATVVIISFTVATQLVWLSPLFFSNKRKRVFK